MGSHRAPDLEERKRIDAAAWADEEFLRAFEDQAFPPELFHHREHLRVAWLLLRQSDASCASERMAEDIRRFAAQHGATQKYHHTMTLAWMRLVAAALFETPELNAFGEFLAAHPALLDGGLLRRYYSLERLRSSAAREGWVEPDLQALPPLRLFGCR